VTLAFHLCEAAALSFPNNEEIEMAEKNLVGLFYGTLKDAGRQILKNLPQIGQDERLQQVFEMLGKRVAGQNL
jgi:hypothetical protein